jgi:hypothetical protein
MKRIALTLAGIFSFASPVFAQPVSVQDKALAEALFREAKDLVEKDKIAEACSKFAESQRLDPKLGTLLYLATCHEQEGKTATAWVEFNEAAALAARTNQPEREKIARERARILERDLPNLTLKTTSPEPGMQVELDGRPFPASGLGTAVPIDPGTHQLVVTAPRKQTWRHEVVAEKGGTLTVQIPALPAKQEAAPAPAPAPVPVRPSPETPDDGSGKRTVGWVLVGAGGIGLVAGTIFGVRASSLESDARVLCPDPKCPTQEGVTMHEDASRNALVSTVAMGAGVVAAGVGLFLILSSPSPPRAAGRPTPVRLTWTPSTSPISAALDAHVRF